MRRALACEKMGIEIVQRRRRDLEIGDAGIAGRDAQQLHLVAASSGPA